MTLSELDDTTAGKVIKAACEYQTTGEMTSDDMIVKAIFAGWKAQMDANNESYKEMCRARSEAGKKGMAKRWGKDNNVITNDNTVITNDSKGITKITDNDNDNDTDNDTDNDKNNIYRVQPSDNHLTTISPPSDNQKSTRFTPPSREEVQAYITEKGYSVNAERFIDFYTAKGWVIGKNPMKDWKAAVRTWAQRDKDESRKPSNNKFKNYEQRNDYDFDALEKALTAN